MKVTIKDIAKEAGVSVSTVSLVLNNKPCRVSESTRQNIRGIAQKYNYRANQTARSLVTRKSNILGLIIPDIENLFFSALSKRIEEYCRAHGYVLIIVNSNDRMADDELLIDLLVSRGVDGLFITVSNESLYEDEGLKNTLANLSIPYVMLDRYFPDLECNKVYFDNELGAFLAVEKFAGYGHTQIACIGISEACKNGNSRVVGFRKAMRHFGLPVDESLILDGNYRFQGGYDSGLQLLDTGISAVFVCNDMMTLGLMRSLQENHIAVPDDLSIISYDNTLHPFMQGTEITSIDQNIDKLATTAGSIIMEHINDPDAEKKTVCLKPQLMEKDSVKNLKLSESYS